MDPLTQTAIVKAAESTIEVGEEAARGFLSKVAGPAAEEAGLLLQDKVKMYRFKNQVKAVAKAQKYLEDASINPGQVPLRTLLPLLEGAALEDNESLSNKWASLLANAASGSGTVVPPSFLTVLSQISPSDASILDHLCRTTRPLVQGRGIRVTEYVIQLVGGDRQLFDMAVDNLERLNLLNGAAEFGENKETGEANLTLEIRGRAGLFLTHFGISFCKACSPPAA